jgi:hypothetical protein
MIDGREFIEWIVSTYEPSVHVEGGAGHYARQPGEASIDVYGVSDMACVLFTIGHLRPTEDERRAWASAFRSLEDDDGSYVERVPTHHRLHSTAFTIAAMELLGLWPRRDLPFATEWSEPVAVARLLDDLDWRDSVYAGSHVGAGMGAIASMVPTLGTAAWLDAYFASLDAHLDEVNGMFGVAKPVQGDTDQIGGTFHYAFLYDWHHRPMAHPDARIDAILGLQRTDGVWADDNPLWLTLDAIYLLARAVERTGHRRPEVEHAVREALHGVHRRAVDPGRREAAFGWYLGAHSLTAVVSILAEGQRFLGHDEILTERPLQLVLDRRPFV